MSKSLKVQAYYVLWVVGNFRAAHGYKLLAWFVSPYNILVLLLPGFKIKQNIAPEELIIC